jgi:hypothetical protein
MRKKGENSVNCAGKSAITPDGINDFTLWGRKSIRPILLISLVALTLPTKIQTSLAEKYGIGHV